MAVVSRIDADTKNWIVDASDDLAARRGAVMDLEAAAHAIDWIRNNCCLYEGDLAGELIDPMPWQLDFWTRLFGWRMWSDDWNQWVRRFRRASWWGAKKNGKSPSLAATGLYMLIGEGEQGQKVYMAAKNGDQAKIAQRHAVEMVRASPSLSVECKTYENTLAIHHQPSNSIQMILTGDDTRGQKAKEGLNGSTMVDEAHVVDRAMMRRIDRAGISRKQPIDLTMSTAGDDPSSWGYERYRYGQQVACGEREDARFLHIEYGIPDEVNEVDIEKDVARWGRIANPAWGYTVKASEFVEDFQRSKGRPVEMAGFLQYRLNRWVGSTNRWLDVSGWGRGKVDLTFPKYLKALRGRECYLGIDLARKLDMASAVFVFPWPESAEEAVRIWPIFWLPEDRAKEQDNLFPFQSWGRKGHLILTPGSVTDYTRIKHDLRGTVESFGFDVRGLYYDERYAEEITQQLVDGETNPATGGTIHSGWGCERFEFKQDITNLTKPAVEFERRVSVGLIEHPDNLVMNWQIGHCEVKRDVNQNIRPVKPEPHSGKKVDGVVAAVMALLGVIEIEDNAPRVR